MYVCFLLWKTCVSWVVIFVLLPLLHSWHVFSRLLMVQKLPMISRDILSVQMTVIRYCFALHPSSLLNSCLSACPYGVVWILSVSLIQAFVVVHSLTSSDVSWLCYHTIQLVCFIMSCSQHFICCAPDCFRNISTHLFWKFIWQVNVLDGVWNHVKFFGSHEQHMDICCHP